MTITVRGQKLRNASRRRYLCVVVRPTPVQRPEGTYVAFARTDKRTDNIDTARTFQRRYNDNDRAGYGVFCVIYDTATDQEIQ